LIEDDLSLRNCNLKGKLTRVVPFSRHHRDSDSYLSWLNDPDVIKGLNLPNYHGGVERSTLQEYADQMAALQSVVFLAVHDITDDAFIGTVKAGQVSLHAQTADIGIMIGQRDRWGRGLGGDAVSVLSTHLFDTARLRKLTAGAMASNPAVISVFQKLGFQQEGRLRQQDLHDGRLYDHLLFGVFAEELRPLHA